MCGEGAAEKNRGQYWLRCCTDISKWQFLDDIFGMVCWKTIGNTSILHVWIWDNTVNIVLCTCCIIYYDVPLLGFIFIYFFQSFVPSTLWFFLSFFFVRNFSCDAITSLFVDAMLLNAWHSWQFSDGGKYITSLQFPWDKSTARLSWREEKKISES